MKKTWITAYDFFSARVAEHSGIDTILVGDSLGMTVYGMEDTKSVTVEMMTRHFEAVKKGAPNTRIVLDFPIGTTENVMVAVETAEIFANAGASIFKIEGGKEMIPIVMELKSRGFEVVGHLGLTPQTSDWRVHGREEKESDEILKCIQTFEALGVTDIVLECVPEPLATKAQELFSGDIVGIGAGRNTNAQVLVFDDAVGRTVSDFSPKFLRRFGDAYLQEKTAVQKYVQAVQNNSFPSVEEVYV